MLTIKSGIDVLTGYQAQLDVPKTSGNSTSDVRSASNPDKTDDTVDISRKAKELEQTYQGKKSKLEQNYNSDAQQLEREFSQEKKRLEREFARKKQSLEINVYA